MPKHEAVEDLTIPRFLRRKAGGRITTSTRIPEGETSSAREPAKLERVQLTEYVRLAETPYEEAGFAIREGVIPRRWYEPQSEQEREEAVSRLHLKISERRLREEMREEKESRPKRADRYAGLVTLEDIVSGIHPRPDLDLVKRALRAGRLEHDRWHFAPELTQTARTLIRNYVPGVTKTSRRSEFAPESRISWRGKNPKREGSDAHARWELLRKHDKRTVAEFLAAGGNPTTLKNAVAKKHVKLGETDGDSGGQGGPEVHREAGENVRQGSEEAGAMAPGEPDREADAVRIPARKTSRRARRHR